jgi:peroxiredoxin
MKYYLAISFLVAFVACTDREKQCTITGEIHGSGKAALLLFKASKFPNIETEIPIIDSSFNFTIKFKHPEVYELVFKDDFYKGSMMVTPFFAEEGNIRVSLKPGWKKSDNIVSGSSLNNALNDYSDHLKEMFWDEIMKYSDSISVMFNSGTALSKEAIELNEKLRATKNDSIRKQLYNELKYLQNTGKDYTPKAQKFRQIQDSIENKKKLWEFDYIDKNSSLISYYFFMVDIKETAKSCCWQEMDKELINKAQSNLDRYTKVFPDHPYNVIIQNTINGLQTIHEGGRFIDFTAPDISGQDVSLSRVIKNNRFTLLDFWSKWCGPCLLTSKEMIPIYKQFKDNGFEIIGITQEYSKTDSIESFIQKQEYPWTTVIDKKTQLGLWDKYNLSEKAGGLFLINSSGQIVAVNLSAQKVKQYLDENLK